MMCSSHMHACIWPLNNGESKNLSYVYAHMSICILCMHACKYKIDISEMLTDCLVTHTHIYSLFLNIGINMKLINHLIIRYVVSYIL